MSNQDATTTSTDHGLSESSYLDSHFEAMRPGELVAVKEFDLTSLLLMPFDPAMFWRLMDAVRHQIPNVHGTLQTFQLPTRLKQSGFVGVDFKSFLSERQRPMLLVERTYLTTILQGMAHMSEQFDATEEVRQAWQPLADVEAPDHIFQHPDFYYRVSRESYCGCRTSA